MGGCQNYGTHWGNIRGILGFYGGIVEKNMETTIMGYINMSRKGGSILDPYVILGALYSICGPGIGHKRSPRNTQAKAGS